MKILNLILVTAFSLAVIACGDESSKDETQNNEEKATVSTVSEKDEAKCASMSKEECAKKCSEMSEEECEKMCEGKSKEECAKMCKEMSEEECEKVCSSKTKMAYTCPMKCEEDKSYAEEGKCPKCEMALAALETEKEEETTVQ